MNAKDIEDIYELSPMQKGILFHSLYAPELGLYFLQLNYTARGKLNLDAFDRALQQVTAKHAVLRTSFYWQEIEKPLQVVHRQVKLPIEQHDWRGIEPATQKARLQSFLESDRRRSFDLSQAPLMRVTLIRLTDDTYQLVLSKHHLILDGWSSALVLKDFMQLYAALCQGEAGLSTPTPSSRFRDYIAWLQRQERSPSEAFWRRSLSGFKAPTSLNYLDDDNLGDRQDRYDEERIQLSAATTATLQAWARQHQLTLNTLVQATWAILLGRYSCQNNVVYGCTVAGRPVDLAGAEEMVGVFINTLPVRVKLDNEQPLLAWLKQLQEQLVAMRQYEWTPLVEVQGWSEVPRGVSLFESIVVFENYPVDRALREWQGDLEIQNTDNFYKTNYPLTVVVYPGSELTIAISYDSRRFAIAAIATILNHFKILLQNMMAHPQARLHDLPLLTEREQQIALMLEQEVTFNFDRKYTSENLRSRFPLATLKKEGEFKALF